MTRRTLVFPPDAQGIARAAAIIRAGGLVAFPTETVYGLGAHALDARAVQGIFEAKGRPADDPLIVHLLSADNLPLVVRTVGPAAQALTRRFWPGPLTLVLPRTDAVPPAVTAGLDTVGVRVPAHPVARALLEAAGVPIAAPSANLFTRTSPTRAEHVLEDLDGRIDLVLDGGLTSVGVESTIVDLSGAGPPRLLRPGGIAAEALAEALGIAELALPTPGNRKAAPGAYPVHYAPRTRLHLAGPSGEPGRARQVLWAEADRRAARGERVGVLLLVDDRDAAAARPALVTARLGAYADPATTAARLFDALRWLDRQGLDVLLARELADPGSGMGRALADRLGRAAAQGRLGAGRSLD